MYTVQALTLNVKRNITSLEHHPLKSTALKQTTDLLLQNVQYKAMVLFMQKQIQI